MVKIVCPTKQLAWHVPGMVVFEQTGGQSLDNTGSMTSVPAPSSTLPNPVREALWHALVGVTVVLPWINPLSSGPHANAIPLLVSGFSALLLIAGYAMLSTGKGARPTPTVPTAVFAAWLMAALLSSAMGLAQYFGLADALTPWVNFTSAGQAFANLRQRNQFASLTSIGLVSLLYLATRPCPTPQFHPRVRMGGILVALVLLALANAASASRTGALQWLMVTALCTLPRQRKGLALASLALLLYTLAVFLLPILLHALTGVTPIGLLSRLSESAGCESRRVLWANVLELLAQKPWFGWGWGELKFAHFSHAYAGPRFCAILDNAHNLPLHLAVELGVPLAASLCAAVLWWVWRRQPWCEPDATRQSAWAVLAIIALHSLVEYPLWYGPFQMALALSLWLLWQGRSTWTLTSPSVQGLVSVTTLLALVFLGYTTWDYMRVTQLYLPQAKRLAAYRDNTLDKARPSHLFAHAVQFAALTTTPLNADSAQRHYTLARQLLHFSPEPRVLQALLKSAQFMGLENAETIAIRQQFQAAYPDAYAQWAQPPLDEH